MQAQHARPSRVCRALRCWHMPLSARRPRLERVALALSTWAWRALSRQVVAQHGVLQLDEQSHARRRCVCARWRREHGSCCLGFDMVAIGDVVARQLVASGRQWL